MVRRLITEVGESAMSRRPGVLRPEVIREDNTHRNEPEPNPEEEGQRVSPDEIDGEEEADGGPREP